MARETYEAHENFLAYQEEIVASPVYADMPDLRYEDGSIQWEAPSNRKGGQFRDSHNKRLQWWKEKAKSEGISILENQWISKTAKLIHPTKRKPCKKCGQYLDIRYCYFSDNLIKKVRKLPYFKDEIALTYLTNIFDFIPQFIETYGDHALVDLPKLLACKQFPQIQYLKTVEGWIDWVEKKYIVAEPSLLSPGVMSNAPDRLDGFHSFNRCCRHTADKGRSKENLALYSTDRRAFEHWVDGNWITANKLMGVISTDYHLKEEHCLNHGTGGNHPRPCSADHIGPISLGFTHRPEFQLLCKSCNSAKNNRMFYSDVLNLLRAEREGKQITSWYLSTLWRLANPLVIDNDTALRFSRILRDNRHNAMMVLADYMRAKQFLFLYTFLNLGYADFNYELEKPEVANHIVKATFKRTPSDLKYVLEQKARVVRVAFSSLIEYSTKENRNALLINIEENTELFKESIYELRAADNEYQTYNNLLSCLLSRENVPEEELRALISTIPNLCLNEKILFARKCIHKIMDNIAQHLYNMWENPRYSRDVVE